MQALLIILSRRRKPPASEIGSLLALQHLWLVVRLAILLVVVRCTTVKLALHAYVAEQRADARRGVNADAARRVEEKSAATASLHEIAMSVRIPDICMYSLIAGWSAAH